MTALIRGDNVCVTEALREFIDKKLTKLNKYSDFSSDLTTVVLNVTKGVHKVEATVKCSSALIRAEESSGDMYASVDLVLDKLDKQFNRYKTKMTRHERHEANRNIVPGVHANLGGVATAVCDSTPETLSAESEVVRTKRFKMKPMYTEEAILQMEMLDHNFFIFNTPDSDKTKIVYRRKDGKIGLIEPD